MQDLINEIIEEVLDRVKKEAFIQVEASGRHVHLSKEHVEALFGYGYKLNKAKDLSQPGQYACKERVMIVGPKGTLKNVVVLGPERKETQVEISLTDSNVLGVKVPIRQSGDLKNTPGLKILANDNVVNLENGAICARRHVHITNEDANKFKVSDNQVVSVKVFGERPLVFDDVVVRVSDNFNTSMHIDYDEANACGFSKGTLGRILKK
ncbi:phosphate propanoyltransferase [Romboutsia maritimum]|uniref:Phosphate propanoyltransferase n=1 Tax=Romboutsia maritimum TaxID=2020948 RepID=A0A371ISN9_9FIRM|nr:ethanolamine utilization phosphate acetyltransferase EutD [Romboutsia maritimum]RDY23492.1 phosphate propanoyltransferase [Romboutsia maritimum]